jgi:hypothetical protein
MPDPAIARILAYTSLNAQRPGHTCMRALKLIIFGMKGQNLAGPY